MSGPRRSRRLDRPAQQRQRQLDPQRHQASTATVTIKDSAGQTAYSGTFGVNPGNQTFTWDGRGNDGRLWPDGKYTLTATGVDANKQPVAISTEVQAQVDSVDLSQNPPLLSINGQTYTLDKIKRIVRPGSTTATN